MPERRRALVALIAGLVTAAAGFAAVGGVQPSSASWTDAHTDVVTVTAAGLPPTGLSCGQSSGILGSAAPVSWTAPSGRAPSGYTIVRTGTNAGTTAIAAGVTSGTVPTSGLNLVSSTVVSVTASYGPWTSAVGTQKLVITGLVGGVLWGCSIQ